MEAKSRFAATLAGLSDRRFVARCLATSIVGIACLARSANTANALEVYFEWGFGNMTVQDTNSFPDLNATTGIIDFNLPLPGYNVQGTVDTVAGSTLTSIIGSPSAALRLTNFVGEAVGAPPFRLRVSFTNQLTGTYSGLVGGDAIDAYADNAFNLAVPAGQDELSFFQGYLDLQVFPPATGIALPAGNPFVPVNSAPVPYGLSGHGPAPLVGTFVNPLLGADLYFTLGANGDQFILPSSAEVGIGQVPEPATISLLAIGLACAAAHTRWRRRRPR